MALCCQPFSHQTSISGWPQNFGIFKGDDGGGVHIQRTNQLLFLKVSKTIPRPLTIIHWNLIKQLISRIFENLVVKPESVEELPPLLPSLSLIKEIEQCDILCVSKEHAIYRHSWHLRLTYYQLRIITDLLA